MTELEQAIVLVEQELQTIDEASGKFDGHNARNWHDRHRCACAAAVERLVTRDARVRQNWDGASISFAGVRATSTSGLTGALNNWLRAAEKRLVAS